MPESELQAITDTSTRLVPLLNQPPMAGVPITRAQREGARYRRFLEALGVAVYTTDARGRITFFNDAAASFWGRRPDLGEEWCGSWRLYWNDGRPMRHEECPMAIAIREQRPVRGYEAIAERPDGSRVSFVPYPTPLRDGKGKLIGAVNVLVDVTDRRRAEDALRATAQALAASNAVKDEFLGLVSHELRTPVTTIFGNARLLMDRADRLSQEDRSSMLSDITSESERLLGIIENLLLLTRLESGAQLDPEPQVLTHVVRKGVDSYMARHPGREIRLHSDSRHIVVDADRVHLEMLLENLLSNADKYSPPGEPIEVFVSTSESEARVSVLDRGFGVSEDEAHKLFAPFYRAEAAKSTGNGIGVGLAVCKRVIDMANGHIWARPRDGGGSDFGFGLPLAEEPSQLEATA
ncbi:MAG TPA: ATP-binding protein [Candidatus Limnocylindria bacterium]|nr:ATP-binding protein [Candidatus Limnocylindria bacterium]